LIALDTNIIVRWLLRDDFDQASRADNLLAEPFFLSSSVLTEIGWVMMSVGNMTRTDFARVAQSLLSLSTAHCHDKDRVRWAIERFAQQGDWADMIHIASASDASAFATFDQSLRRAAGPGAPVPITLV
jgi:predicted nucleic-acid-binding protein